MITATENREIDKFWDLLFNSEYSEEIEENCDTDSVLYLSLSTKEN